VLQGFQPFARGPRRTARSSRAGNRRADDDRHTAVADARALVPVGAGRGLRREQRERDGAEQREQRDRGGATDTTLT
jgi:hypothetical protein